MNLSSFIVKCRHTNSVWKLKRSILLLPFLSSPLFFFVFTWVSTIYVYFVLQNATSKLKNPRICKNPGKEEKKPSPKVFWLCLTLCHYIAIRNALIAGLANLILSFLVYLGKKYRFDASEWDKGIVKNTSHHLNIRLSNKTNWSLFNLLKLLKNEIRKGQITEQNKKKFGCKTENWLVLGFIVLSCIWAALDPTLCCMYLV